MWLKQLTFVLILVVAANYMVAQQLETVDTNVIVNLTTSETQQNPAVAMDADGDYVVVWESQGQDGSGYGIFARCYDRWGDPVSGEFQVNSNTEGDQRAPDVAMDQDGNFVVVWMDDLVEGSGYGWSARLRRYDCGCAVASSERRANSGRSNHQKFPRISMNASGEHVVIWNEVSLDGSTFSIEGRRIASNGANLQGDVLLSAAETSTLQANADVAIDASENYAVTWQGTDSDGNGIIAARFNSSSVKQGSDFTVNATETNNQTEPTIGMAEDGKFQIAWASFDQDGDAEGIFMQRFNAAGSTLGAETQVSVNSVNGQYDPFVATTKEGNFTVSWSSYLQDESHDGVYLRSYQADGTAITGEEQPSTRTSDFQQSSAMAHYGSGQDLIVAWQDGLNNSAESRDGENYGVYQQRYFIDAGDNSTYSGTIYVDENATGNNRGSTWGNAFEDLQEALRYATVFDIDSILVAEGTYYTSGATGACYGSYNESPFDHFAIPGGMTLIGSYPAGGGSFDERNVMSTPSILSGDIGVVGDSTDNSYNVIRTVNVNGAILVDGFVIAEGNGHSAPFDLDVWYAGGAWNNHTLNGSTSSVVARNLRILGNSSTSAGGMFNYCTEGSMTVELTNCSISGNDCSVYGGGMINMVESGATATLVVDMINCTVTDNSAGAEGGGMLVGQGSGSATINFSNGIIWGNSAPLHQEVLNFYTSPVLNTSYSLVSTDSAAFCGVVDSGAVCGPGMLFGVDPLFNDPDGADNELGTLDDDLTLGGCSLAEDAGSNALIPSGINYDLAGTQRIFRDSVDMGVFENLMANEYEVVNNADAGAGSLRQALQDACLLDTIVFNPSLMGQTISLTGAELTLDRDVYILGLGIDDLTINGNFNSRVATIPMGNSIGIEGLTLTGGISATDGGAILNNGWLTLKDVKFVTNLNAGDRRSITNYGEVIVGPGVLLLK